MKGFADIKIGDYVFCYDELSHDYCEHCLHILGMEYDKECITEGNPDGKKFFGEDIDEEMWGDDYLTWVTEGNFCKILD